MLSKDLRTVIKFGYQETLCLACFKLDSDVLVMQICKSHSKYEKSAVIKDQEEPILKQYTPLQAKR
jgi:hypothetical protein